MLVKGKDDLSLVYIYVFGMLSVCVVIELVGCDVGLVINVNLL